jgi:hypothetical protein
MPSRGGDTAALTGRHSRPLVSGHEGKTAKKYLFMVGQAAFRRRPPVQGPGARAGSPRGYEQRSSDLPPLKRGAVAGESCWWPNRVMCKAGYQRMARVARKAAKIAADNGSGRRERRRGWEAQDNQLEESCSPMRYCFISSCAISTEV